MTREEAIKKFKDLIFGGIDYDDCCTRDVYSSEKEAFEMAIQALSQEPCSVSVSEKEPNEITEEVTLRFFKNSLKVRWHDFVIYNVEWLKKNWQMEMDIVCGVKPCDDAISREYLKKIAQSEGAYGYVSAHDIATAPSVTQKSGKCKNCKYFEYDSVAKVDGIPLIVAHEICNKWGDGCKTSEDGYCYLYEPQESEDKE